MTEQSPKQFLAMIDRGGLVPRERLDAAVAQLQKKTTSVTVDQLADFLIAEQLITPWHREKLRAGKYRGFFLGKYKLLRLLGSGGMCSVYLAEHNILHHFRAIKVLPRSRVADRSYLDRFYREGRAAATLNHPNIVRVYDIDHERETHYLVMEFVEGDNLYDAVQQHGPFSFRAAADYIIQAAVGLQHAHDARLVHRDVKPANLLVAESNLLKISDLGLALFREEDYSLTMVHNERVLGTADYLAPEQAINSHTVDHRADIYGLGCSLYYLLTGQPPFPSGTLAQRIAMHQSSEPKSLLEYRPDCPIELVRICQKMMRKSPDERFQSCREIEAELQRILNRLDDQPPHLAFSDSEPAVAEVEIKKASPAPNAPAAEPRTKPARSAASAKLPVPANPKTASPPPAPKSPKSPPSPASPPTSATPSKGPAPIVGPPSDVGMPAQKAIGAQDIARLSSLATRPKRRNPREFWLAVAIVLAMAIILVVVIIVAVKFSISSTRKPENNRPPRTFFAVNSVDSQFVEVQTNRTRFIPMLPRNWVSFPSKSTPGNEFFGMSFIHSGPIVSQRRST